MINCGCNLCDLAEVENFYCTISPMEGLTLLIVMGPRVVESQVSTDWEVQQGIV